MVRVELLRQLPAALDRPVAERRPLLVVGQEARLLEPRPQRLPLRAQGIDLIEVRFQLEKQLLGDLAEAVGEQQRDRRGGRCALGQPNL